MCQAHVLQATRAATDNGHNEYVTHPALQVFQRSHQKLKARTTKMATRTAVMLLVAVVLGTVAAQTQSPYPVLNITKGAPLPVLKQLQPDASGWITLNMQPATIVVCGGSLW